MEVSLQALKAVCLLGNGKSVSRCCNFLFCFPRLTLQTDEAKVSMRFGEIAENERNKIIVISDVAEGSEADKVRK